MQLEEITEEVREILQTNLKAIVELENELILKSAELVNLGVVEIQTHPEIIFIEQALNAYAADPENLLIFELLLTETQTLLNNLNEHNYHFKEMYESKISCYKAVVSQLKLTMLFCNRTIH